MTLRTISSQLTLYDPREAYAVARRLVCDLFDLTSAEIYSGALDRLSPEEDRLLNVAVARLREGEPLQYVVGYTTFCGRRFKVTPACLIPRPETEELCEWVAQEQPSASTLLDIGTGSGCIAITMKLSLPRCAVTAWDVSPDALSVARCNARSNGADVTFCQQDALCPPADLAVWDVIVSNPPYVCDKERAGMEPMVVDHEPHLALFVPDDDPLLFYRAISRYAWNALRPGGRLYFEINSAYPDAVMALLHGVGYGDVRMRRDVFGLPRMISARR